MNRNFFLLSVFLFLIMPSRMLFAQSTKGIFTTKDYVKAIQAINEVMIHDVVAPTGASRYYAYITMAGYEVTSQQNPDEYPDLSIVLNKFPPVSFKWEGKIDPSFAVLYSTIRMGEELLPSGFMLDSSKQILITKAKKKLNASVVQNTMSYADSMVKVMMKYAFADHYREINTMVKYTPKSGAGNWKPTPPAYMQALDPHWNEIRPFTMDSASQFPAKPCAVYSDDTSSAFFHLAYETYSVGVHLTEEQKAIANFWDCNPFAVQEVGHIDYGIKKISPGGHWLNITGLACEKENFPLEKTVQAHTLVAVALADGFISCWDEKFRSNRIRPETYINEKIDINWRPLIQTPPFPEYPSGHSVASNVSATVLTKLFGDNFKYTDVTEEEFDQPARSFTSFQQTADEASISRLYGGIHFRDALENGAAQGKEIGAWVLKKFGK